MDSKTWVPGFHKAEMVGLGIHDFKVKFVKIQ